MRKLLGVLSAALFFAAPVVWAGNLPEPGSGLIAVAAGSVLTYQGQVRFDYSFPGHLNNPRVYVACYQAGDLVYGEAGGAGDTFTLGGGWSLWVERGGGPADCEATLFYFGVNGQPNKEWNGRGQQVYVQVAQTAFHADA